MNARVAFPGASPPQIADFRRFDGWTRIFRFLFTGGFGEEERVGEIDGVSGFGNALPDLQMTTR